MDAIIYPCPKLSGGLADIVRKRAEFEFERSLTVSCILEWVPLLWHTTRRGSNRDSGRGEHRCPGKWKIIIRKKLIAYNLSGKLERDLSYQIQMLISSLPNCPACRTYEIATRFWEVVICPIYMCLTVYEFSFIWFDLCLFITLFNFILNYIRIVTFWIFTYYKIWIMLVIYYFIWNYWIFYFVACLEVFWSVMS